VSQFVSGAGKEETIRIVKPQLIIMPVFWLIRYISVCVCDVTIAPRIGSTAGNKLRWRNCPHKIHCKSHCDLRNSGLVPFEVTANYSFSQYRLQTLILKIPASAKLAVKYWPSRQPQTYAVERFRPAIF